MEGWWCGLDPGIFGAYHARRFMRLSPFSPLPTTRFLNFVLWTPYLSIWVGERRKFGEPPFPVKHMHSYVRHGTSRHADSVLAYELEETCCQ
jgi:hypothetical protein